MAARQNLDGKEIKPLTICLIGGGGFIGSHLCDKLMHETSHTALVIDGVFKKCNHLARNLSQWSGRLKFQKPGDYQNIGGHIQRSDLVLYIAPVCTPANYATNTFDGIFSNFVDSISVAKLCIENHKRLIHISGSEVYGGNIGSCLPVDHPLKQERNFNILNEDTSPCILGPITEQGWSYACAKQIVERFIYAGFTEQGLNFTIVRPFNWIGERMDVDPGYDGEGLPRVVDCFLNNLRFGDPLMLVDGGQSRTTFCHIRDAIDALLLIIDNPDQANGHIFNVGNPHNEVTVKELAEMIMEIYAQVSGNTSSTITDESSEEFFEIGYDDSDRLLPDITSINRELGWSPSMALNDLLEVTLKDQQLAYSQSIKKQASNLSDVLANLRRQ